MELLENAQTTTVEDASRLVHSLTIFEPYAEHGILGIAQYKLAIQRLCARLAPQILARTNDAAVENRFTQLLLAIMRNVPLEWIPRAELAVPLLIRSLQRDAGNLGLRISAAQSLLNLIAAGGRHLEGDLRSVTEILLDCADALKPSTTLVWRVEK